MQSGEHIFLRSFIHYFPSLSIFVNLFSFQYKYHDHSIFNFIALIMSTCMVVLVSIRIMAIPSLLFLIEFSSLKKSIAGITIKLNNG